MIREYLRAHRGGVLTGIVTAVVGAVVATSAIVSSGYHAQRIDLGDGTVWVPSAEYGAVGRANTGVLQLNTAVEAASDRLSVVQHGSSVYSVDESKATVTKVDVADATLGDPVTLPSGSPQVFFAGSTAVIGNAATGQLWSTPVARLEDFDASSKADLTLGADAVFDASDSSVAVYSPRTRTASLVSVGETLTVQDHWTVQMPRRDDLQTAVVGGHVAVLDRDTGVLAIDGRSVDLGARVGGRPALQRSTDDASSVVVAGTAGIVRVSASGSVSVTALEVSGSAARPFVGGASADGTAAGDCVYAAWSGGQGMDSCAGRALQRLDRMSGGADLQIVHNGATVVANDPTSGRSWAIGRSGQLIDNWSDLVKRDQDQREEQTTDDDPEVEKDQKPPVAVDDDLGARPGRTTALPVLLNDYDPNGDPLVISDVEGIDDGIGTVSIVGDGQRLQVSLTDRASGTVSFRYTITDGNGGSASADVRVTVRPYSENSAPEQVRDTSMYAVQNGHVSGDVLGDWVDPDGDPVYLESATASDGDDVSTTPDGMLDFRDASGRAGDRSAQVVVSDGRAEGRGSVTVHVAAAGKAKLFADAFAVTAYAGAPLTIRPLDHVRGGNGPVTLTSVPSVSRATVTPSYDAGTFRFASDEVGDHQLEYTVTDGTRTATGIVRVSVLTPPDASAAPVTTPKTVFVTTLSTKDTDVTATDHDPAGGVLLVTGLRGIEPRSGVEASVLDQHTVRVTLTAPLDGPVTFSYTETNGLAEATGTITVIEIPKPDQVQPPVAQADSVTVRVGDVATIDVLANDSQPEGEPLTLLPDLVQNVPGDAGLLFVSGDSLRYLAPETPGNYTAVYRVAGPDGQHADAAVSIAVREKDAATNAAPVPDTVTARVVAGQAVRVSIPLSGIDPDGDSVQLVGVASNPDRGSVSDVTDDSLVYEAGDYSAGTDEFTYTVVDALGARATGTIRVGIAPRADQASNPVAEPDHVSIRPGGTVTVRVLENDTDPDGGRLTVSAAEPSDDAVTAKVVRGQQLRVTPPRSAKSGDFAVLYTATNASGGSSTAFLTVTVDEDAQPLRPEVEDTTLDLQDILHRQTVTVDVLRNVFFAEGTTADLRVGLVDGYEQSVRLTEDGRVQVRIGDSSQVIPFSVGRRDHPDVVSYGFIHVPGFADALPQVNRSAPAITVKSESPVSIPLAKYVVTANGETAEVTDPSTVKATHANGADLVTDRSTLRFTSAKLYYGNASISFEVTDGSSANGGKGRTATLVLPIRVEPRTNQPPAFTGTSLDMQPGESRTVDLTRLTNYPYPQDVPELRYSVTAKPTGATATISGQRLTIAVADTAKKDTSTTIGIGVADDANTGRSGVLTVDVVGSTRPLVAPGADRAVTKRGQTTSIDVLANDQPTNPFPDERLRVVAIRGLSGGLPAGVTVTPSADRSRLAVSVSGTAKPVDTHLQYQVADATNDPARYVWGDVTISVQDVPEAPGAPSRTGSYDGGQITLTWSAPQANNSPITSYRVQGTNGLTKDCGLATVCTLTGLDPTLTYQFTVVAVNAIGTSKASPASSRMSADYVPAPPTGLALKPSSTVPNRLTATWNAVPRPNRGSEVDHYVVTLNGPDGSVTRDVGRSLQAEFDDLNAGSVYTVAVSPRNDAARDGAPIQWNSISTTGSAIGRPDAPVVTASRPAENSDGMSTVTISWTPVGAAGGTGPTYAVYRLDPGAQGTDCTNPSGTPVADPTGAGDRVGSGTQRYAVIARNGSFCNIGYGTTQTFQRPTSTTGSAVSLEQVDATHWRVRFTEPNPADGVDHYEIDPGTGFQVMSGDWTGVPGGAYNTATDVVVRACAGSAQGSFCATPDNSKHRTAAAVDAGVALGPAKHGVPLSFTRFPPAGQGVTITYEVQWYQDLLIGGPVPMGGPVTVDPNNPPTPPDAADGVAVRATVSVNGTQLSAMSDFGTPAAIAAADPPPEPEPTDPPPTDPSQPPDPGTGE